MTKAKSRAAKRRGRPRKEGAREPNGRISRSSVEQIDKLALETRMRHMGISAAQAKDQKAGSFIGYLNLLGPRDGLSDDQYDAATTFIDIRNAYQRSLQSPGAIYDPQAIGGTGDDPEAYEAWAKTCEERYDAAKGAIRDAQFQNRTENLWAAVDMVILRDQRLSHLIGATRIVCNVLARHFKIAQTSSKAA